MRPEISSGLVGVAWLAIVILLVITVSSPVGQLTVFTIVSVTAGILAFISKMPSRVGRIVVAVGALICAAISFPDAVRDAEQYAKRNKATLTSTQPQASGKMESRK